MSYPTTMALETFRSPAAAVLLALLAAACSSGDGVVESVAPRFLSLSIASATRQTGRAAQRVASGPAVRILDRAGRPVGGIPVTFTVTSGGGTVTPAVVTTGEDGLARANWQLGADGPQQVQMASPRLGGAPLTVSADVLTSVGYAIDLRLLTSASDAHWSALRAAAERIGQVVVGALPPVDLTSAPSCDGLPLSGTIEGLLILVRIEAMDGAGGILGQAGPCLVRSTSQLPVVGIMELDAADLDALQADGELAAVLLHEMLHVVGFGTVWDAYARSPLSPLVTGELTEDSAFTGAGALRAAKEANGAPSSWTAVPLENCGVESPRPCGSGTQDSHWREPVFEDELMTGWLSGPSQPLSRTTIAAMADMGYEVNLEAGDPFDLTAAALRGAPASMRRPGTYLGDDVLGIPAVAVP